MSKQERKRKTSLGVLFWIAVILLILVVWLVNRQNIEQVMENTGLVEVINQRIGVDENAESGEEDGDQISVTQDRPGGEPEAGSDGGSAESTGNEADRDTSTDSPTDGQSTNSTESQGDRRDDEQADSQSDQSTEDEQTVETETVTPPAENASVQDGPTEKVRNYLIYLVEIADNGDIAVVPRERSVNFVDSPLTRTIQTLIDQPAESEGGSIRNLIPEGSSLNRIWIEGGVAYFDLNEQFRFNPMGMEGHRLQLEQFVRTATQFPTVDAVQFLIDGQEVDFLGGEGIFIGEPLRPSDFP
jgi:germination protein M